MVRRGFASDVFYFISPSTKNLSPLNPLDLPPPPDLPPSPTSSHNETTSQLSTLSTSSPRPESPNPNPSPPKTAASLEDIITSSSPPDEHECPCQSIPGSVASRSSISETIPMARPSLTPPALPSLESGGSRVAFKDEEAEVFITTSRSDGEYPRHVSWNGCVRTYVHVYIT